VTPEERIERLEAEVAALKRGLVLHDALLDAVEERAFRAGQAGRRRPASTPGRRAANSHLRVV
jgi:hypothetical protein